MHRIIMNISEDNGKEPFLKTRLNSKHYNQTVYYSYDLYFQGGSFQGNDLAIPQGDERLKQRCL